MCGISPIMFYLSTRLILWSLTLARSVIEVDIFAGQERGYWMKKVQNAHRATASRHRPWTD